MTTLYSAGGKTLSDIEETVISHIDRELFLALALLEKTVNINSGTMNHAGVAEVGRVYMDELEHIGFESTWISPPAEVNRAGHLFSEIKGSQGKRLLLIGHLDTVFEPNSPFQRFQLRGNRATGPGIADMKAGNVAIIFALRALRSAGVLDNAQVIVALTGDEESAGRPLSVSRHQLIEAAKRSDIALEFEPGGETAGKAVIARRGVTRWFLEVSSKVHHSAKIFANDVGVGAIFSAAKILQRFYQELHKEKDLTINPGLILGGGQIEFDSQTSQGTVFGKENVVASKVVIQGDLRFASTAQETAARMRMKQIAANALPKTHANLRFVHGYPAMEPTSGNTSLLLQLSDISEALGTGSLKAFPIAARGASDVAFVADQVDALAGLGAIGGGTHSPNEYIDIDEFPGVIKRAALLIYRLTRP